jgi:hypothetical protein
MMAGKKAKVETVHMCIDRILTGDQKIRAMQLAIAENKKNRPKIKRLPGVSSHPLKMALQAGKMWADGRLLKIYFLDGSKIQRQRVTEHASKWLKYANVKFDFAATRAASDIRISFQADPGSWSYIGTDNLGIPKNEPTMNFGWLKDDTDDTEYNRVVVHEFGHALGCIHEHQNPKGGIKWNEAAVYQYFAGPPNNWSKEETYSNVIQKYSIDQLNASTFDGKSIMLYSFPGALIVGGKGTPSNTQLSRRDKIFIKKMYPK